MRCFFMEHGIPLIYLNQNQIKIVIQMRSLTAVFWFINP